MKVISTDPPSVVIVDQVKSLDGKARGARRSGKVSSQVLIEVQARLRALLQL
jgi:mRNA interferase MazF